MVALVVIAVEHLQHCWLVMITFVLHIQESATTKYPGELGKNYTMASQKQWLFVGPGLPEILAIPVLE
jgi:hypothetical protein